MNRDRGHIANRILLILLMAVITVAGLVYVLFTTSTIIINDTHQETTISFSWWGNDDRNSYTLEGVQEFMEKNPEIAVDTTYSVWSGYEQKERIHMMSGTEPDLMQINYNWIHTYSPDGNGYYDLYQLGDTLDLTAYTDADLAPAVVNGKLNGLPTSYNATVFYFNKTIYDQYGLELPKTWEDLVADAKVLGQDGIYPLYMDRKHLFLSVLAWYEQKSGKTVFSSDDGSYIGDADTAAQLLSLYQTIIEDGVAPYPKDFGFDSYLKAKAAGAGFWASEAARYTDDLTEDGYEMVLVDPMTTKDPARSPGWRVKPTMLYAISAYTDHPEEAAKLLNFLVSDPDMASLQGLERGIPINRKAYETLTEEGTLEGADKAAGEQVIDRLQSDALMVPAMEDSDVIDAFEDAGDRLLYDNGKLQDCAKDLDENWRAIVNS